ncbi:aldo/keto reductase, partial [Candidatus Bathyarchaeota archaeon]
MLYKRLGRDGVEVSAIGLGTWEFGQTKAWGTGRIENYKRIVDYALDHGINFIDTAEGYGRSEEILGMILEGRRDDVILATKIGGYDWRYENMLKRLSKSLERLRTDYVDLYQIHWPKIKGRYGCKSGME